MLDCFTEEKSDHPSLPIHTVAAPDYPDWLATQQNEAKAWLESTGFTGKAGRAAIIPGKDGKLSAAVMVSGRSTSLWDFARLQETLPAVDWHLPPDLDDSARMQATLGWALAGYRFSRYKKSDAKRARLLLGECSASSEAHVLAEAIYLGRDLINTPANDLGPEELEQVCRTVGERFGADIETIKGDSLIEQSFPAVHTVGRASARAPRVIDLTWGKADAPKVTLVGKGVCFDTGGLDLKPAAGMALMKKDMGGAATTLAVAQAIMALGLPIRLRLLIGAVENSVAGNAFRPGDVIATRKGLNVEIGNTDAEGRLVLADLLALGDEDQPDLMVDCATLTGAARVALGAELPALFTDDDRLAADLLDAGMQVEDPLWRLPLHQPYRDIIDSPIADINNAGAGGMAGSITAALFLQDFVSTSRSWAHLDIYGWTPSAKPGRPKGGEATALRALVAMIKKRFPKQD